MTDTCRWCGAKKAFTTTIRRHWYDCGSWDHDGGAAWQNKDCRIAELEGMVERLTKQRDEARDGREAARAIVAEVRETDPGFPHLAYWLREWPWMEEKHEDA